MPSLYVLTRAFHARDPEDYDRRLFYAGTVFLNDFKDVLKELGKVYKLTPDELRALETWDNVSASGSTVELWPLKHAFDEAYAAVTMVLYNGQSGVPRRFDVRAPKPRPQPRVTLTETTPVEAYPAGD